MINIGDVADWATVIGSLGSFINKAPDLYKICTKKFEKEARRKTKQNVISLMLGSDIPSGFDEEIQNLVLKNVVCSDWVEQIDWKMAQQRILDYKKKIDGKEKLPLLIVCEDRAHPVNLGAWLILGYYFDYRSQVNIICVREYNGRRIQYKMADGMIEAGKSLPIPFVKEHDMFDPDRKYKGLAVYICCSERAVKEDIIPFENYVKDHEHLGELYCLRYLSNESLSENHCFEEAAREIEREIRSQVGKIREKTEEPVIHLFMNLAAPMALSLGRQFGNLGNIQFYGFFNAEKRYYPAILLRDKNRV
ncbi:MAG: SAVED domain-containing protein [Firmicutes bacterium]|nr:SAVED domain-containing protein [Bacillota bacterium]